jgi:hypothetical protein
MRWHVVWWVPVFEGTCYLHLHGRMEWLFCPKDGGSRVFWNTGTLSRKYIVSHLRIHLNSFYCDNLRSLILYNHFQVKLYNITTRIEGGRCGYISQQGIQPRSLMLDRKLDSLSMTLNRYTVFSTWGELLCDRYVGRMYLFFNSLIWRTQKWGNCNQYEISGVPEFCSFSQSDVNHLNNIQSDHLYQSFE